MCFLNSIAAGFTLFKAQIVVCVLQTQRLSNKLDLKKYSAADHVKVTILARSPRRRKAVTMVHECRRNAKFASTYAQGQEEQEEEAIQGDVQG